MADPDNVAGWPHAQSSTESQGRRRGGKIMTKWSVSQPYTHLWSVSLSLQVTLSTAFFPIPSPSSDSCMDLLQLLPCTFCASVSPSTSQNNSWTAPIGICFLNRKGIFQAEDFGFTTPWSWRGLAGGGAGPAILVPMPMSNLFLQSSTIYMLVWYFIRKMIKVFKFSFGGTLCSFHDGLHSPLIHRIMWAN